MCAPWTGPGWKPRRSGRARSLDLPEIGIILPLADIYEDMAFDPT